MGNGCIPKVLSLLFFTQMYSDDIALPFYLIDYFIKYLHNTLRNKHDFKVLAEKLVKFG